jgi:hypothetical protein
MMQYKRASTSASVYYTTKNAAAQPNRWLAPHIDAHLRSVVPGWLI